MSIFTEKLVETDWTFAPIYFYYNFDGINEEDC